MNTRQSVASWSEKHNPVWRRTSRWIHPVHKAAIKVKRVQPTAYMLQPIWDKQRIELLSSTIATAIYSDVLLSLTLHAACDHSPEQLLCGKVRSVDPYAGKLMLQQADGSAQLIHMLHIADIRVIHPND